MFIVLASSNYILVQDQGPIVPVSNDVHAVSAHRDVGFVGGENCLCEKQHRLSPGCPNLSRRKVLPGGCFADIAKSNKFSVLEAARRSGSAIRVGLSCSYTNQTSHQCCSRYQFVHLFLLFVERRNVSRFRHSEQSPSPKSEP